MSKDYFLHDESIDTREEFKTAEDAYKVILGKRRNPEKCSNNKQDTIKTTI